MHAVQNAMIVISCFLITCLSLVFVDNPALNTSSPNEGHANPMANVHPMGSFPILTHTAYGEQPVATKINAQRRGTI